MLDYVAWLPDGVQWQPYGPFAEPRRPAGQFVLGFRVLRLVLGRCVGQERFF